MDYWNVLTRVPKLWNLENEEEDVPKTQEEDAPETQEENAPATQEEEKNGQVVNAQPSEVQQKQEETNQIIVKTKEIDQSPRVSQKENYSASYKAAVNFIQLLRRDIMMKTKLEERNLVRLFWRWLKKSPPDKCQQPHN